MASNSSIRYRDRLAGSQLIRWIADDLVALLRAAPGFEAHLTADSALLLSGEPVADLNFGLVDTSPASVERLAEYRSLLTQRGMPAVFLLPESDPSLAAAASTVGLQPVGAMPLMALRDSGPEPRGVLVEMAAVSDAMALGDVRTLLHRALDLPMESMDRLLPADLPEDTRAEIFLARQGEVPVAVVFTVRSGDRVGIWNMAVHPDRQRQGIGFAVMSWLLGYHRQRGVELCYLGASSAGEGLYRRCGFKEIARCTLWMAEPGTPK